MSLTVGTAWRSDKLFVGHGLVADSVKDLFHVMGSKLTVEMDPTLNVENRRKVVFGRDLRICRLDGSLLIPYGFTNERSPSFERWYRAMLPATSSDIITGSRTGFGKGIVRKKVEKTVKLAAEQKIPFIRGKSAIEGGNCFLFQRADGSTKGVVGVHSLVLTLMALEEQGYFEVPEVKLQLSEMQSGYEAPSEECLRIARNLSYYARYHGLQDALELVEAELRPLARETSDRVKELKEKKAALNKELSVFEGETGYRRKLLSPLSASEEASLDFKQKGIELEAKLSLARQVMAEELNIAAKDLAIVPQVKFHIDMEMFASPDRKTLFVHDESLVQNILNANPRKSLSEQRYLKASQERLKAFGAIYEKTVSILKQQGFDVKRLPGIFEADGENAVYFMNGFFVPCHDGEHFFTNGAMQFPWFDGGFKEAFFAQMPNSKVYFINGELIDQMMTQCNAGVHCVTWDGGKPQDL